MSIDTQETEKGGRIPSLTLGWRLQMALGGMKVQAMADALGVNRATIGRWMHDKGAPPRRAYVLQWAMVTGTDPQWLETGVEPGPSPDGGTSPTLGYVLPMLARRRAPSARIAA